MRKWMSAFAAGTVIALVVACGSVRGGETDPLPMPPPPPPPPPPAAMETTDPAPADSLFAPDEDEADAAVVPEAPPAPLPDDLDLSPAPAPETTATPPAMTGMGEMGEMGEVTIGYIRGGRVNIRAGRNTRYEIITTVDEGTPVMVYAKVEDWMKIGYPEGQLCFIHQDRVQGEAPANIPEEGVSREVVGEGEAKLRVRPWERSSIVGAVQPGQLVTVMGVRGHWLKIAPPDTAYAWVFGKYVRLEGEVETVQPSGEEPPPGDTGAADRLRRERETQQTIVDAQIQEKIKQRQEEARRRAEERIRAQQAKLDSIVANIESELEAIDRETQAQMEWIDRATVRVDVIEAHQPGGLPQSGYTGWVEYVGRVRQRPAAYRLVKGGEAIFLLRSVKYDLAPFVNRRVVVNGQVELAPGWEANVLVVDQIDLLDEGAPPVREQAWSGGVLIEEGPRTPLIIQRRELPDTVEEELFEVDETAGYYETTEVDRVEGIEEVTETVEETEPVTEAITPVYESGEDLIIFED